MSQKHAWGLFGKDGEFIAAFRFKPERVHIIPFESGRGYNGWTDFHGPMYCYTIEGSENATCKKIAVPKPIKSKA